jgi:hypothetical protein
MEIVLRSIAALVVLPSLIALSGCSSSSSNGPPPACCFEPYPGGGTACYCDSNNPHGTRITVKISGDVCTLYETQQDGALVDTADGGTPSTTMTCGGDGG